MDSSALAQNLVEAMAETQDPLSKAIDFHPIICTGDGPQCEWARASQIGKKPLSFGHHETRLKRSPVSL
jgi:hypothetical protein